MDPRPARSSRARPPSTHGSPCGGGWPLDRTLYQSIKGLCAAARVVRRGGPLWLASPCPEGAGSGEFRDVLSRVDGPGSFFRLVEDPLFFTVDQWMAQHLYEVAADHPIIVQCEGLDGDWLRGRGLESVDTEERGWEALRAHLKTGRCRVGTLPRGPFTFATPADDPVETSIAMDL